MHAIILRTSSIILDLVSICQYSGTCAMVGPAQAYTGSKQLSLSRRSPGSVSGRVFPGVRARSDLSSAAPGFFVPIARLPVWRPHRRCRAYRAGGRGSGPRTPDFLSDGANPARMDQVVPV